MTRYFGKVCEKHPDLLGERLVSQRKCIRCHDEKSKARHKQKRAEDPVYRFLNNLYFSEYAAAKRKSDPEYRTKKVELANLRYLAKLQRIPPWADFDKIREIYQQAQVKGMTVDHVIPLRGQFVSGLHVHNNLQLLPGSVNSSKGNKFLEN